MQFYPEQALDIIEFNKIQQWLLSHCVSEAGKKLVADLRIHTNIDYVRKALEETYEYYQILVSGIPFPTPFHLSLDKALQLLRIENSVLSTEELCAIRLLSPYTRQLHTFTKVYEEADYPRLKACILETTFDLQVLNIINNVIDDKGVIYDHASDDLLNIREDLTQKRQQQRRLFERALKKYGKLGYLASTTEAFHNNRRTLAVLSENKRIVRGVIHGVSDTQQTVYIEPEETIEINNDIAYLVSAELKEIHRILKETTTFIRPFAPLIKQWYQLSAQMDFIRSKAQVGRMVDGVKPQLLKDAQINLIQAYHPLLLHQNNQSQKRTVPIELKLSKDKRILILSGPNAGGKTVSMKTVGLLQVMVQAGLLVPVHPDSQFGMFKQFMVHIGDTQSIENELSTYSAHLKDMKHFISEADKRSLFLIDELGGGSDPNMGGAFAEAIVEELVKQQAFGVVTTHYLNLKVMASKNNAILNGAMLFDEMNLTPLYQLTLGKPGNSYTFDIAKRIGLPIAVIQRAQQLTQRSHVRLEKLLSFVEQKSVELQKKDQHVSEAIQKSEQLIKQYEQLIDKENKQQALEHLKLQNKIKKEELDYLRDTERKFKQLIHEWKKTEDKGKVIKDAEKLLFRRKQVDDHAKKAKQVDALYYVLNTPPQIGDLVRHTITHQVGRIVEANANKKWTIQIGKLPFQIDITEWVVVKPKPKQSDNKKENKSNNKS